MANSEQLETPGESLMRCFPREQLSSRDTILVIDDDEDIRAIVKGCLAEILDGFKIIDAPTAHKAVGELLRQGVAESIAFISTDGTMPRMHGIDLAKFLRGGSANPTGFFESVTSRLHRDEDDGVRLPDEVKRALENVPIQLVSSDTLEESDRQRLVEEGTVDSIVKKPINVSDILDGVIRAIKQVQSKAEKDSEIESVAA